MNFILIVIGLFVALYSFFEANIYLSLFGDRDIYCPEQFKKAEKATDVSAVLHHIYLMVYGFIMLIIGVSRLTPTEIVVKPLIGGLTVLSLSDFLLILYVERRYKLKTMKEEIQEK